LDPGAATGVGGDQWGFVGEQAEDQKSNKQPDADPILDGFISSTGEQSGENLDPLANLMGENNSSSESWEDSEDEWWKSESDHVPADQHMVNIRPVAPEPDFEPSTPTPPPPPPRTPVQPPTPPVMEEDEDNPFAESEAVLGAESTGSSNILDSVPGGGAHAPHLHLHHQSQDGRRPLLTKLRHRLWAISKTCGRWRRHWALGI